MPGGTPRPPALRSTLTITMQHQLGLHLQDAPADPVCLYLQANALDSVWRCKCCEQLHRGCSSGLLSSSCSCDNAQRHEGKAWHREAQDGGSCGKETRPQAAVAAHRVQEQQQRQASRAPDTCRYNPPPQPGLEALHCTLQARGCPGTALLVAALYLATVLPGFCKNESVLPSLSPLPIDEAHALSAATSTPSCSLHPFKY